MKHIFLIILGLSISLFADFTRDNTTQIVTDNETGLQWQDNTAVSKKWIEAIDYCENLTLGGYSDWRLPNINELASIVDDTKANPSISSVFRYTEWNYYWSSTSYVGRSASAWNIYFSYNKQGYSNKDLHSFYVRCVRSE